MTILAITGLGSWTRKRHTTKDSWTEVQSLLMSLSFTSAFICFRAVLNKFSIELRSGDLAGITCMFTLAESKARFAFADVCDGSLSMTNYRESFSRFSAILNKIENFRLINLEKYASDIFIWFCTDNAMPMYTILQPINADVFHHRVPYSFCT